MKRLPGRLLLINPQVEKSVGGSVAGCCPSGCEKQNYIEPQFNSDLLLLLLEPWGSAFCITASVGWCMVDVKQRQGNFSVTTVTWLHGVTSWVLCVHLTAYLYSYLFIYLINRYMCLQGQWDSSDQQILIWNWVKANMRLRQHRNSVMWVWHPTHHYSPPAHQHPALSQLLHVWLQHTVALASPPRDILTPWM